MSLSVRVMRWNRRVPLATHRLMDPDQLISSLGLAVGLPNLRFDANGCARLSVEGAPALNFEREDGAIHVYSVLGPLPAEGREILFTILLRGNLFGASTAGAALAIDELQDEVVLCRTFAAESTGADGFATDVEALVDAAEHWRARLGAAITPGEPIAEAPASYRLMNPLLRG